MTDKEKTTTSKFISLILRHDPSKAGITLDENGWADVSALLVGINKASHTQISFDDLKDIVATSDKQRFVFNDDLAKIRPIKVTVSRSMWRSRRLSHPTRCITGRWGVLSVQ